MCDTIYSIYWWEIEPYIEKHFRPKIQLNLTGVIFDTANALFKVRALNLQYIRARFTNTHFCDLHWKECCNKSLAESALSVTRFSNMEDMLYAYVRDSK